MALLEPDIIIVCWLQSGRSLTGKKNLFRNMVFSKTTACSSFVQPWLVAIGGWRLVGVAGCRLAVGGWRRLAAVGSCPFSPLSGQYSTCSVFKFADLIGWPWYVCTGVCHKG